MYICGRCRTEVDPESPDVIALMHWIPTRSMGDEVDQWIEGPGEFFHKNHAPKIGLEWRPPMTDAS